MNTHLYFNQSSGPLDTRPGGGYGSLRTRPDPVLGKTAGNMTVFPTGARYDAEPHDDEDWDEIDDYVDSVVKKKMGSMLDMTSMKSDFGAQASTDAKTMTKGHQAVAEQMQFTDGMRNGLSPFSHKTIYKAGGFDGPPIGSGGAGQAFNTTGPARKTGTQYGSSRAPLDYLDVDNMQFNHFSLQDYFDSDDSDVNLWPMIKHNTRVKRMLDNIERE